jgi:hypothetical protein
MADSDRKPVFLHAFEGIRGPNEPLVARCRGVGDQPPTLEDCILYAGHAGVSFGSRFGPIYGFLPRTLGIDPLTIITRLKSLNPAERVFPGEVSDHRPIFELAAEYGLTRMPPVEVITLECSYPVGAADTIEKVVSEQLKGVDLTYSFPGRGGNCNCVTWLTDVGLTLPPHHPEGQMAKFIPVLRELLLSEPFVVETKS